MFECYTGIIRNTKDLDIFLRPEHCDWALDTIADAGYKTEVTSPVWLGKALYKSNFVDVIFSSGNGICTVDDQWFVNAREGMVHDFSVLLAPPEEIIWSKAFVTERERYDGADVMHLLLMAGKDLDWERLISRFGPHWRVLFSYLVLFGYVYPAERQLIPDEILQNFAKKVLEEQQEVLTSPRICNGPYLSTRQYKIDIESWGFENPLSTPTNRIH